MYVVTGITSKVGGALARTLLAAGQPVCGVVRGVRKGEAWASRECKARACTAAPRDSWDGLFRSQGMRNPEPRMRMLDGFNEGWIDFQDDGRKGIKERTDAIDVIAALVASAVASPLSL